MRLSRKWTALGAAAVTLAFAAVAGAATVSNGGFEGAAFAGWTINSKGGGEWQQGQPGDLNPVPEGANAAFTVQGNPSSNVLYQDVALEPDMTHKLSMQLAYFNHAQRFYTPHNLSQKGGGGGGPIMKRRAKNPNQQYRIDVMKPSAGLRSVKKSDVLKTVFRTDKGEPKHKEWFEFHVSLTKFAGKTVRLRFAEVDNQGNFTAAVDDVKITSTP